MKKNKKTVERMPLQIQPPMELRAKLKTLADQSGLSVNRVATFCFEKGLPIVEPILEQLKKAA